ncbi:hypothetical protein AR687_15900 [Flavobacteriaceae bacterium CRH]|nr:hypothetical protein AR687_15900 [Flavobacteriaceae bacterium CRH]
MVNTGYKSFAKLELYYQDDQSYAGQTKDNVITDIDYIAPVQDYLSCPPTARYYSEEKTIHITRNNCSQGQIGDTVACNVLAKMFVSNKSVQDANAQRDLWLSENAQVYANNLGKCRLII